MRSCTGNTSWKVWFSKRLLSGCASCLLHVWCKTWKIAHCMGLFVEDMLYWPTFHVGIKSVVPCCMVAPEWIKPASIHTGQSFSNGILCYWPALLAEGRVDSLQCQSVESCDIFIWMEDLVTWIWFIDIMLDLHIGIQFIMCLSYCFVTNACCNSIHVMYWGKHCNFRNTAEAISWRWSVPEDDRKKLLTRLYKEHGLEVPKDLAKAKTHATCGAEWQQ